MPSVGTDNTVIPPNQDASMSSAEFKQDKQESGDQRRLREMVQRVHDDPKLMEQLRRTGEAGGVSMNRNGTYRLTSEPETIGAVHGRTEDAQRRDAEQGDGTEEGRRKSKQVALEEGHATEGTKKEARKAAAAEKAEAKKGSAKPKAASRNAKFGSKAKK